VTNLETSEAREERLAKNEVIFRTVNDAIEQDEFSLRPSTSEISEEVTPLSVLAGRVRRPVFETARV